MSVKAGQAHKPPDLSGLPDEFTELVTGCLARHPAQRPTLDEVLAYAVPHLDRADLDDISTLLPASVMALIDAEESAVAQVHRRARVKPSATPLPEARSLPEPQGTYAEILSRYERTSDQEDTWPGLGAVRSVVVAARVGMRVVVLLVIVVVAWRFISDRVGSGQDGPSRDANVLWRAGRMDGVGPANWSSPAGPATLMGGVLYTATRDGNGVRALDARTGGVLWSHNRGSGQSSLEALAPSVSDGIVTGTDGSTVYALDAKSGKRRWQHPWKNGEGIGPVAGGGVVAVADSYGGGGVTAYSAKTGATVWKRNLDLVGDKLRDLAATTDRLYLVSDYRLASLRLDSGRILWSAEVGSGLGNNTASSIAGVLGDRVILEGGEWVEARSTSGGGRLWRVPLPELGAFWPLVSTQAIIVHLCALSCTSDTKVIPPHEVALDPASGKRLWSANVELPISNLPPSEWLQGGLLLRWPIEDGSERGIKAVSARSGKVLKTWQVTETTPRFVLSDRRRLYVVDYDTRTMAMRR
jgi:PQQ-like domain/PQQ enzyme repeat